MGMNKSLRIFSLVAVFGTMASGQANAQQRIGSFDRMDADKDGKLSKEELPERMRGNFEKVDLNKDRAISRDEDAAFRRRGAAQAKNPPVLDALDVKRDIDYVGDGNPKQMLDLLLPKKKVDKKPPLVVFIHGGAWRGGSRNVGMARLPELLEKTGYAGATISYRLTDEAIWPSQIHDCKAAIRFLRANADKYGYDGEKIAVWGTSAGGHLVAMLGTSGDVKELEGDLGANDEVSSRVQAVINYFGPSELLTMGDFDSTMDHNGPDAPESKLVGGELQKNPDKAKSASPITYMSKDDPPYLIVHGDKDPLVPIQQSVKLDALFDRTGVNSIFIKVLGGGHGNGFDEAALGAKIRSFLTTVFEGAESGLKDGEISSRSVTP
jgi:acetyl esterase/lipase